MAAISHISSALRLTLNAGTDGDKLVTKNVSVSNISETASADALINVAGMLGGLLEYPVTEVRKYSVSTLKA